MEVLQKGDGWSMNVTCTGAGNDGGGCGSLLKVSAEDLFLTCNFAWGFIEQTKYITIECPVCKIYTDLNEYDIPPQIRKNVKFKSDK